MEAHARIVTVQHQNALGYARIVGLVGAILVAAGSYPTGALPFGNIHTIPLDVAGIAGLTAWLVGTGLLVAAWWWVGRVARRGDLALRWILVTTVMWALPFLLTVPMASRDIYSYAAQGDLFAHGLDPYAVGPSALPSQWLDAVAPTWRDTTAPYGPLFLLAAGAAAAASGDNIIVAIGLLRLVAVAGVVLTAATLPTLARHCGVAPGTAAWLGLASPLALLHLVAGAHNDALMIGLVVAALAAATQRRAVVSGVAIGLAVAVKATAVVVAPFAVLLVLPAVAQRWPMVRASALVGAGMTVAYGALTLVSGLGVGWFGALGSSGKSMQWTSPTTGIGIAIGYVGALFGHPGVERPAVFVTRVVGVVALAVLLVVLWWQVRAVTDTSALVLRAGWALAAVVILGPVFHAWYALLPLIVLAAATTDDRVRRWLAGFTAALTFLVAPNGFSLALPTKMPGAFAQVALAITLTVILVRRWRRSTTIAQVVPAAAGPGVDSQVAAVTATTAAEAAPSNDTPLPAKQCDATHS